MVEEFAGEVRLRLSSSLAENLTGIAHNLGTADQG